MATKQKVFLFLLMTVSLPCSLFAQDGKLLLEQGRVKITHEGTAKFFTTVGEETPVFAGDEIHTAENTRAKIILLEQNDEISLYAKTFFKVNKTEKSFRTVNLWLGKAKFLIRSLTERTDTAQAAKFRVNTITATLGVKGTEFVVGATPKTTNLLTLSGLVTIANIRLPEIAIEVGANQASSVKKSAPPEPPIPVTEELKNQILQSDAPDKWSDEAFQEEQQDRGQQTTTDTEAETGETSDITKTIDIMENTIENIDQIQEDSAASNPESPDVKIRLEYQ